MAGCFVIIGKDGIFLFEFEFIRFEKTFDIRFNTVGFFILEETNGNVRIVIGDAPMQECVFEQIKGYQELVDEYKSKGVDVELVDFRELKSEVKNNVHIATINNNGFILTHPVLFCKCFSKISPFFG